MTRPKIALAILAALVTATVTFDGGTTLVQAAGAYEVTLTNNRNGRTSPWATKTWPSEAACKSALGNIQDYLTGVANNQVPPVEYNDQVDPQLGMSVDVVMINLIQNTGVTPDLTIGCRAVEVKGSPA